MAYTAKKLLEIARAEIGYREKNSDSNLDSKTAPNDGNGNHTKYARDLHAAGYYNGDKCGYAWCDCFVDWCFYVLCGKDAAKAQAMECQTGSYGASCYYSAQYYKQAGRYFTSNPQPGDQIFFGDFDHTGIVEAVDTTTITTIEGNTSNMVARRTYSRNSSYITGFGRPRFDPATEAATPATDSAPSVGAWSAEAREWAAKSGLIVGTGKNKDGSTNYDWQGPVTREQLVTVLYRFHSL